MAKKDLYTQFAELLEYPADDLKLKVEECIKTLAEFQQYQPEAVEEMKRFQADLKEMPLDDVQGIYSYTFELTSDYTLDLGYHLFDGFKRSGSLSAIKAMYREYNFPIDEVAKGELPDHLPIVLRFLGHIEDEAMKKNFRETFVILAVEKLKKNFEKNAKNIYKHLVNSVYKVLDTDVKGG